MAKLRCIIGAASPMTDWSVPLAQYSMWAVLRENGTRDDDKEYNDWFR